MQELFREIFRLYGAAARPVRTVRVTAPLGGDFPADTVYINGCGSPAAHAGLLELSSEPCRGLTAGSCRMPAVPLYDHAAAVPPDFLPLGRVLAYAAPAGGAPAPAALEFPGNRFWFNFDPELAVRGIERESYFVKKRPFYTYFPFNVQSVPPALRQTASRFLKRGNKKRGTAVFPAFPKDQSVELLTNLLRLPAGRLGGAALTAPAWPGGKKYAFTVTHDVDSGWIYRDGNLRLFLDEETRLGIRGAWYFVANLYPHDHAAIEELAAAGHEIGLHGDNHDHKIAFLSERAMRRRLDGCRPFLERYRVTGFRSPHYLRTPAFYEVLKDYVRYDTSMHDSYNPANAVDLLREGCSALHPFTLSDGPGALLEIPVTIPEDYELYDPERGADSIARVQLAQIEEIKRRGGLANLVIHPEPHMSGRPHCLEAFRRVLAAAAADKDCWLCRPDEVYGHWTAA